MRQTVVGSCLALVIVVPANAAETSQEFVVDPARSEVAVHVGRAGLFKFAGHEHEVLATRLGGRIEANGAHIESSSVNLTFEAAALQVSGRGEPPEDVPKVQARMIGPELLDVARFPTITFRSTKVEGRSAGAESYDLRVTGELALHGVTRSITLPLRVTVSADALRASGTLVVRQTDYGLSPVSVAGVVKVKDELSIDFTIVAALALSTRPPGTEQRPEMPHGLREEAKIPGL